MATKLLKSEDFTWGKNLTLVFRNASINLTISSDESLISYDVELKDNSELIDFGKDDTKRIQKTNTSPTRRVS
jgi:hypothetical protein